MITLYKIDNLGALRVWSIAVNYNEVIIIKTGVYGGNYITHNEHITQGLAGRTVDEQIQSRVNSRINKQRDKGYHDTRELARSNVNKNGMDTYAPMLAQRFDKINPKKIKVEGALVQMKLDGNRMLVTRSDGDLIAYTRNGKSIDTLGHITDELEFLEEGQTIDGEVYIHGMALKDIGSRMRKYQSGTTDLRYHAYDLVMDDSYSVRHAALSAMPFRESVILEPAWTYNPDTLKAELDNARGRGYEGLMVRLDHAGYAPGKRDKSLLKVKFRHDAEFPIIDVVKDKVGKGKLVFRLPNGDTFTTVAPGTAQEKRDVVANPEAYVGRSATVSFAYYTDFGIPFHAVCERYV